MLARMQPNFWGEGEHDATLRWNKGLLILPLLLAVAPTAEATTTVSDFRLKGNTATAIFEAVDPSNSCLLNFVSVASADQIERVLQGGRTQLLRTTITVIQVDTCNDLLLFSR